MMMGGGMPPAEKLLDFKGSSQAAARHAAPGAR